MTVYSLRLDYGDNSFKASSIIGVYKTLRLAEQYQRTTRKHLSMVEFVKKHVEDVWADTGKVVKYEDVWRKNYPDHDYSIFSLYENIVAEPFSFTELVITELEVIEE